MKPPQLYAGLMSGSSLDGIDAALGTFSVDEVSLHTACTIPFAPALRKDLLELSSTEHVSLEDLGRIDRQLGEAMAEAVHSLLQKAGVKAHEVRAVGCHGHTIRHTSNTSPSFSLQIGDPNTVCERTGMDTIADFRRRDVAAGGQGAPLAPAFHAVTFSSEEHSRLILNIGGIANLSILPATKSDEQLRGFDIGPGNMLMDFWCQRCWQEDFDRDGARAAQGVLVTELLGYLNTHPMLLRSPPHSIAREDFPGDWLLRGIEKCATDLSAHDVQATLSEFTVQNVAAAIRQYGGAGRELFVCGGGAQNTDLMRRLQQVLGVEYQVAATDVLGIAAQWVEALAWAWLAFCRLNEVPANAPGVTGAAGMRVLGAIWCAENTNTKPL